MFQSHCDASSAIVLAALRHTAGAKNAAQSVAAITKSKIAKSPLRNAATIVPPAKNVLNIKKRFKFLKFKQRKSSRMPKLLSSTKREAAVTAYNILTVAFIVTTLFAITTHLCHQMTLLQNSVQVKTNHKV